MTAELISVGTELLMGQILNTDAQYLSRQMQALGIDVYHQSVVGDNMDRLCEAIATAMGRSDVLRLSGGLGPTEDDLTKEAVAKHLGLEMILDQPTVEWLNGYFAKTGKTITPNNYRQCMFPQGAKILPNTCGTAPGCVCETGNQAIVVLPGPPHELKAMFELEVMPYLSAKTNKKLYSKMLRIFGMGESTVEYELREIIDAQTNPTLATYATISETALRVTAACETIEEGKALVEETVEKIVNILGDVVYSTDDEELVNVVVGMLKEREATLSVAESVTGGMLASRLVSVAGVSDVFVEGIVTYSNSAKIRLGVRENTIKTFGAVSPQTAIEMAQSMRLRTGSDYAVSTTGVAGPGPDADGNPQGRAYVGFASKEGAWAKEVNINGNRERVRTSVTLHALDALRRNLK